MEELKVTQKAYDLCLYGVPPIDKIPRDYPERALRLEGFTIGDVRRAKPSRPWTPQARACFIRAGERSGKEGKNPFLVHALEHAHDRALEIVY